MTGLELTSKKAAEELEASKQKARKQVVTLETGFKIETAEEKAPRDFGGRGGRSTRGGGGRGDRPARSGRGGRGAPLADRAPRMERPAALAGAQIAINDASAFPSLG